MVFDWYDVLLYSPIQAGVDAKELFHLYIMIWIQNRRLSLLESCKLDKVFIWFLCVAFFNSKPNCGEVKNIFLLHTFGVISLWRIIERLTHSFVSITKLVNSIR